MWDYMHFLLYLQHKDRTEFTGAESYVSKLVAEGNLEWIPFKKSLLLEHTETTATATQQEQLQETMHRLGTLERSISHMLNKVDRMSNGDDGGKAKADPVD